MFPPEQGSLLHVLRPEHPGCQAEFHHDDALVVAAGFARANSLVGLYGHIRDKFFSRALKSCAAKAWLISYFL